MTERTPLQLAADALGNLFDRPHPVGEGLGEFTCHFPSMFCGEARKYSLRAKWDPFSHHLSMVLGSNFVLQPLREKQRLRKLLEQSVDPFTWTLEAPGRLDLADEGKGTLRPFYKADIEYAPLLDEEIEPEFRSALVRGFCTLELLSPIFSQIEEGYLPTAPERLKSLTLAHGFWKMGIDEQDVPFSN